MILPAGLFFTAPEGARWCDQNDVRYRGKDADKTKYLILSLVAT